MAPFRTIGLITKPNDGHLADTVRNLLEYLSSKSIELLVDQSAASLLQNTGLVAQSRAVVAERCDLAIVVGGDGALLHAARSLVSADVPLLGINRGRLGFLVDISPDDMVTHLDTILAGRYQEEQRFLLRGQALRDGQPIAESDAFNDIVVRVCQVARMIEFETSIDGRYLNTQRADGLIVATPTGSTAYALSGGGPILCPTLNAIVLVPICPHTLSNRPLVVDADSQIEVEICAHNAVPALVSFDGQNDIDLQAHDRITITRLPHPLRLIQPPHHDYFEILRAKLRWGEQP